MKKRSLFFLVISICLIIVFILAGCNGGVDQVSYDKPHDDATI